MSANSEKMSTLDLRIRFFVAQMVDFSFFSTFSNYIAISSLLSASPDGCCWLHAFVAGWKSVLHRFTVALFVLHPKVVVSVSLRCFSFASFSHEVCSRNRFLLRHSRSSNILFTAATRLTPARTESFLKTRGSSLSSDLFLSERKSPMLAPCSADVTGYHKQLPFDRHLPSTTWVHLPSDLVYVGPRLGHLEPCRSPFSFGLF